MGNTLVLGVGNTLRTDEGAGVHTMHFLQREYALPNPKFIDGGTLSFTLAGDIVDGANLIIFDAAGPTKTAERISVIATTLTGGRVRYKLIQPTRWQNCAAPGVLNAFTDRPRSQSFTR